MSHVVDDIVNPIGAITGIDPVKQATGFTGTGFQSKPSASGSSQQSSSGGGSASRGSSSMTDMLNQLASQQIQKNQQANQFKQFQPMQFAPPQYNMSGMGFGQQLSQLSTPMQSSMNVAGQTFNRWSGGG